MFSDAFGTCLTDQTVLETETATFWCQLRDTSIEGEPVWYYEGQKVEQSEK